MFMLGVVCWSIEEGRICSFQNRLYLLAASRRLTVGSQKATAAGRVGNSGDIAETASVLNNDQLS